MRQICLALTALLVSLHCPMPLPAQNPSLSSAIQNSRSDIDVSNGNLVGPGALRLRHATAHTCYVFLGEDHGMAEVPEFADALLGDLMQYKTTTLALEISPSIANQLSLELSSRNPSQSFAAFLQQYPTTVPFYNTSEEFEFLIHAKSRIGTSLRLIGFDQEFVGASKFLLKLVGDEALSNDLRQELNDLQKEEHEAYSRAERSGKSEDLFLLTADEAKLQTFSMRLKSRGLNSVPVDDLLASRQIYDMFLKENHRSNEMRDLLMKRNFVRMHGDTPPCGILFKAGSNHGFRGIGPLYTRELGNFLAESADAYSNGGVHILIVGGIGESLQFQGVAAPMKITRYDVLSDAQLQPLKPFVEFALAQKTWSLFDLTALRHSSEAQPDLQRFIYGYDFLVVVPHPTAAHQIPDASK